MKKIRFIYNPVSGNGILKNRLDEIIEKFQRRGFQIVPHKLLGKKDIQTIFDFDEDFTEYEAIVVAGGDGTVHDIVNVMMNKNIDLPLGIIPSGTSNDFASYLGLPKNFSECIDLITLKQNVEYVDLGRVNNKYFINVVAGGILSSIAHKAHKKLKNVIGMFAYYLKALEELPNLKPFDIEITYDGKKIHRNVLMFLVLNSSIAGGFKIAPTAKVNDGKFDVCIIKNCSMAEFGSLFIKLLREEHVKDNKIEFFQTDKISINCSSNVDTDVDGEKGNDFPLDIEVIPKKLRVFI